MNILINSIEGSEKKIVANIETGGEGCNIMEESEGPELTVEMIVKTIEYYNE